MKTHTLTVLAALLVACQADPDMDAPLDPSTAPIEAYDPLDLVDPLIGTGGEGAEIANVNPGASMPHGMTLVGPDTRKLSGAPLFYHCAGYWYEDTHIYGFSHTHNHGMGVPDYSAVALMPRDGWDPAYTTMAGRQAPFDHAEEFARPGSYRVILQDTGTDVTLAATTHGGHTRMVFEDGVEPVVILDMGHALTGTEVGEGSWVSFEPGSSRVEGYQNYLGAYSERFGGLQAHFVAEVTPAPIGGGAWDDPEAPVAGATESEGNTGGIWLEFPEGTTQVDVRLALSWVDHDGAEANLLAELPDDDLEARIAEAESAWREHLGRVRVRGGTDDEQVIFHTAAYHASLMPSRLDDVDGRYRGVDQEIHTTDEPLYSDFSLWDTFRTLHPFYMLVWPELQESFNRSIVQMAVDGGTLPKWPLAHGYTGGMVGSPATHVLAGSWLKGLQDFDADAGFEAALDVASGPMPGPGRSGIEEYIDEGYVPVERGGGSVSETLEYAWADHALARWGEDLGRPETDALYAQAENWRNVWNGEFGYFTGRCMDPSTSDCAADGQDDGWVWPGDRPNPPAVWESHYTEGNAWHYLWYVPYDVQAMIEVQHEGDLDAFHARYETYWDDVRAEPNDLLPDTFYWHGNEPVMHYAFLGSLSGAPHLTADASRWVMANRYYNDPVGLDGNDDAGTLSAWFLLASMGFFPVAGTADYAVASPLWERLEIDRPDGSTWVIRAPFSTDANRYVQALTVGGTPHDAPVIDHATLTGGEVVFDLADAPGAWPTAE